MIPIHRARNKLQAMQAVAGLAVAVGHACGRVCVAAFLCFMTMPPAIAFSSSWPPSNFMLHRTEREREREKPGAVAEKEVGGPVFEEEDIDAVRPASLGGQTDGVH